ncbi:MAG: RluA family pseudouridine synthase [Candidatus Gracilibacteria bacterium]|nr:RluA family pseudouridine synthase [Candidatus Gracilibacteria bacterium]
MKIFTIEENDANGRLDKFLKKLFPSASISLIYKLNRKDKIKIKFEGSEGKFKRRDNEYKLQIGDEVKIFLSDSEYDLLTKSTKTSEEKPLGKSDKLSKEDIVFEDADLLVLNKPSGINVHPGDHKTKETNIIAQVQDYLGDKLNSLTFKPSLVHRIDRDTSGILLIAKKKDILVKLVGDFKDHKKVKKTYFALVLGRLSRKEGIITKKLERIEDAQNENKVRVSENGLTAVSHFKLIEEYNLNTPEGNLIISAVEVKIETGRMHQIRVHMDSIGNPILGDKAYGDKKINSYLSKNYSLNRQMLHAWKIGFFHYARNKEVTLEARLKKDMIEFIERIKRAK